MQAWRGVFTLCMTTIKLDSPAYDPARYSGLSLSVEWVINYQFIIKIQVDLIEVIIYYLFTVLWIWAGRKNNEMTLLFFITSCLSVAMAMLLLLVLILVTMTLLKLFLCAFVARKLNLQINRFHHYFLWKEDINIIL